MRRIGSIFGNRKSSKPTTSSRKTPSSHSKQKASKSYEDDFLDGVVLETHLVQLRSLENRSRLLKKRYTNKCKTYKSVWEQHCRVLSDELASMRKTQKEVKADIIRIRRIVASKDICTHRWFATAGAGQAYRYKIVPEPTQEFHCKNCGLYVFVPVEKACEIKQKPVNKRVIAPSDIIKFYENHV